MKILAFTGMRFTERAGELQELAAPPFDQIGPELRDRLQAKNRHQFAHLTRAVPGPENDPHAHAKAIHDRWLAEGAIASDAEPALYPYAIEMATGQRRLGLLALAGIGPSSEGSIRPHELTVDKPLEDRLSLLETLRVDLEPVMFIVDDDGSLDSMLLEDAVGQEIGAHVDAAGDRHVLYRVTDRARIERYQSMLDNKSAVIADGHHRTKVAQLFARKHQPREGTAACAKMAVLISVASEALRIDPIHRAICLEVDRDKLAAMASSHRLLDHRTGREVAAAVAAAEAPAIGIRFRGGPAELWQLDTERLPDDLPGNDTALPAVLLHFALLPAAGHGIETATNGSILYRSDPDELWRMAQDHTCSVAVWLPPMDPADFARATATGDVLPAKATRFLPKVVSGLVWASHEANVL